MIRHTLAALAVVATLAGAACAPLPEGAPPETRRQVDVRRVQAAAQVVATTLITAGEAAMSMERWTDAERGDIKKAMDALAIANEQVQKAGADIDLRGVADSMLAVASRMVPMLGLSDDSRILATTAIGIMRGLLVAIPPREAAQAA